MVLRATSILAVGAHPDDIELGCGGTLFKAVKSGTKITAIYMTKGELSGDKNTRVKESRKALSILSVDKVYFADFPDANVPNSYRAIEFLERFVSDNDVSAVLTHSVNDVHQDHRQIGWLSMSAFRNVPIVLAYESPRATSAFAPNYFVDISDCTDHKWAALKCHESQYAKRYLAYESMVNLASFRGSQVGLKAAEAFEVVRYVESLW